MLPPPHDHMHTHCVSVLTPTFVATQRADRVTVIYTLDFTDSTDRAIAKVVARAFEEVAKGGVPPATFSPLSPPQEIADIVPAPSARPASLVGWLGFSVFATHLDTPAKFENAVTQLVMFRTYLDYHIKAAKSYLHMRMRDRIAGWLQVLNRAQPDEFKGVAAAAPAGAASAVSAVVSPRAGVASARF
jgi:actin related protein 2/3 complex, subunit 2